MSGQARTVEWTQTVSLRDILLVHLDYALSLFGGMGLIFGLNLVCNICVSSLMRTESGWLAEFFLLKQLIRVFLENEWAGTYSRMDAYLFSTRHLACASGLCTVFEVWG